MSEIELLMKIKKKGYKNINELLESISKLSESTLRRKLNKLSDAGYLQLLHGGIINVIPEDKLSVADKYKKDLFSREKAQIAKRAADLIEENDVIFLENGTTVRKMIKYLVGKNITIYTNGIFNIEIFEKYKVEYRLIPGKVMYHEGSIVGEEALIYLNDIIFDKVFIGANGIHKTFGITTPNSAEAFLKKGLLKNAINSYILIDKSKFYHRSKFKICEFDENHVIT